MGNHSGPRKRDRIGLGLLAGNTGRHSDKPVLEPDPSPAAGRRSGHATAAETQPLDPAATFDLSGWHRRRHPFWRWYWTALAVAVVVIGTYSGVSTQMGSRPSNQGVPASESPSLETPSERHPLYGPERVPDGLDPLPGSRLRAPSVRPSETSSGAPTPTLRIVSPSPDASTSRQAPREIIPRTATPSSPAPVPPDTPSPSVSATETAGQPLPRVSVTISLPVPLPTG